MCGYVELKKQLLVALEELLPPALIVSTVLGWLALTVSLFLSLRAITPHSLAAQIVVAALSLLLSAAAVFFAFLLLLSASDRPPSEICLAGETLVETPSGPERIDRLRPGDLVWSWDKSSRQRVARRIVSVLQCNASDVCELSFAGEEFVLRATRNHRFLTVRGWARCGGLRPGDRLTRVLPDGTVGAGRLAAVRRAPGLGRSSTCGSNGPIRSCAAALSPATSLP